MKTTSVFLLTPVLFLFAAGCADHPKDPITKVIAHRGAWKASGAPQNSIASLQEAISLNCHGSEFDVWMTADSIPVVNHDADFYGLKVEEKTYAELAEQRHPNGEPIPTVEEYLKAGMGQKNTRLVMEIKTSGVSKERTLALTDKCVQMVRDLGARGIVDYIAFDYDACLRVKQLDPGANVMYLNGDKPPEQVAQDKLDGLDYNHAVFRKNEHWLGDAHEKGLQINVWTVNDKNLMKWFIGKNADFITTDEPEILLELLHPAGSQTENK